MQDQDIEKINQAFEAAVEALTIFAQAVNEFAELVVTRFYENVWLHIVEIRRVEFYFDLAAWYIPSGLAWFLAERWPVRFLPELRTGP